MKLKYDFVINNVAGSTVAVPVGKKDDGLNGYIRLNETGTSIFELLKNDVTRDEIIDSLMNEYDGAERSEIAECVDSFLQKLKEADII